MKLKGGAVIKRSIKNGLALLGSDGHYWPGKASTGHRAFVKFIKLLKPELVIYNGDALDAPTISRFLPIGWEYMPSVSAELATGKERMGEIEDAAGEAETIWTLGNHDARFETRLADKVPEYKGVPGIHLRDHFPNWTSAWEVEINGKVNVKHRFSGGMHAIYQNMIKSGRSMFTGHLHSLQVAAFTDDNGTRFAADTGMLANPKGPQFIGYTESNPLNWREGFIVLTFDGSKLRWPEPVYATGPNTVVFRGKTYEV